MLVVFVLGYAAIAMEHTIRVDKAATALLTGGNHLDHLSVWRE